MISNKINLFSIWLISLIFCVIAIILIGGYTRISDSGLSITEWKPITGVLFPLSQSAWEIEFNKYKLIDEFKLVNSLMTLEEFKFIYFYSSESVDSSSESSLESSASSSESSSVTAILGADSSETLSSIPEPILPS